MSDFDILLAREYSKRRGLFDKTSPHFKDKLYSENAWREMSNIIGYNVTILKDRLLQLRNRYNVEKRKYDYLRSKNPGARAKWSMFYHMNFLEGHIRQRRRTRGPGKTFYNSIKSEEARMNGNHPRRRGRPRKIPLEEIINGNDNTNDDDDDDDDDESLLDEAEIKDEIRSDTNSNSGDGEEDNDGQFINPANLLAQTTSEEPHESDNNIPSSTLPQPQAQQQQVNGGYAADTGYAMKLQHTPTKYLAFGQFVTASLAELPSEKALDLLQQFTTQLVGAMRKTTTDDSEKGDE